MIATRERTRTVWILTHRRVGDLNQMLCLARALGWSTSVKQLRFRASKLAAVPVLARRLFDAANSDPIGPPWPDLVLCAEARASTMARAIKAHSAGAVKIVCLGRPAGSPAGFDLVLTTPQYRLPRGDNIVEFALPLTSPPVLPAGAAKAEADNAGELQRPLMAVLVGGTSLPDRLDAAAAAAMGRHLVDQAGTATLVFVTSPRTEAAAASALAAVVPAPHVVHLWRGKGDDAYATALAKADEVVVTSDSVSMVADALAAGKKVAIYRLPQHHTARNRLVDWLHAGAQRNGAGWLRPAAWLFDHGIIEVRPDRRRLFDRLAAEGRVHWFGEAPTARPAGATAESPTEAAVARVKELFSS